MAIKYVYILLFALILLTFADAKCQEKKPIETPDNANTQKIDQPEVLMRKEMTGGIMIHSNGFGVNFRKGKHKTGYKKRMFEFDYVTMKHPKEFKTVNPGVENSKGFLYGKLNSFSILRAGYGIQKVLYEKDMGKGIEIRYHYFIGPSIGFTKPMYLQILHHIPGTHEYETSTEKYDPAKHFPDDIYGKAPFANGLDEIAIHPGIYGKFGFSFEYGSERETVRTLETGVILDAFSKKIPIMALTQNKQFFISLYLSINFGSRWY